MKIEGKVLELREFPSPPTYSKVSSRSLLFFAVLDITLGKNSALVSNLKKRFVGIEVVFIYLTFKLYLNPQESVNTDQNFDF